METIIKWPGGKSTEYKHIKSLIPNYDRYIEPFFGGGAVFFKEEPKKAIVNDLNEDLISFYLLIKNNNSVFYYYLEKLLTIRKKVVMFNKSNEKEIVELFRRLINKNISQDNLKIKTKEVLNKKYNYFVSLFNPYDIVDCDKMFKEMNIRLLKKIIRINKIIQKKEKEFTDQDLINNIKTGFMGGLYYHLRNRYNEKRISSSSLNEEQYYAIYYFIREFCYGSMFRFNKSGGFNVPYGGNSYNDKSFENKIQKVYQAQKYFKNTEIYNLDFEEFLTNIKINKNDFIFLDPPYDSEFSTYGENVFNKVDQKRLEQVLRKINANFLMIIKNTSFIYNLYNKDEYFISSFKKQYASNIKNRNDRSVKHLIVTNYQNN